MKLLDFAWNTPGRNTPAWTWGFVAAGDVQVVVRPEESVEPAIQGQLTPCENDISRACITRCTCGRQATWDIHSTQRRRWELIG